MTKQEYLAQIDLVNETGTYKADWSSLSNHKTPDWFTEYKFGIFIHWGIYSVPAFGNEWYSRSMYDPSHREFEHHRKTYGDQNVFGYKDFIPMFQAEHFDATAWVKLFEQSGAKYIMPVAEHHDGFAMYDTEWNRWNAAKMGPCKNIIGELKEACNAYGLNFCASTHRAEHYFFMNMGRTFDSDVNDEGYADFYGPAYYSKEFHSDTLHATTADTYSIGPDEAWLQDWLVRTCELIDRYQPKMLYFDWWIHNHAYKQYLKKLTAYYYNRANEWGEEVTINYKHEAFPPTVATFDIERGALVGISPIPWQTDTAIGIHSWGYTNDNVFKTSRQIICDLIDIVSKNGNLLLNIGPKPDGTITEEETKVLLDVGAWLKTNGEGIYGTTYWNVFGEGEVNAEEGFFKDNDEKQFTPRDFRFTYKRGFLYAFHMNPTSTAQIRTLAKRKTPDFIIRSVSLLGSTEPIAFDRNETCLDITLPDGVNTDLPVCYKIEME